MYISLSRRKFINFFVNWLPSNINHVSCSPFVVAKLSLLLLSSVICICPAFIELIYIQTILYNGIIMAAFLFRPNQCRCVFSTLLYNVLCLLIIFTYFTWLVFYLKFAIYRLEFPKKDNLVWKLKTFYRKVNNTHYISRMIGLWLDSM